MAKIKLTDGKIIENLRLGGDCFYAKANFDFGVFDGNLRDVEIICDDEDMPNENIPGVHKLMTVQITNNDKNFASFILWDVDKKDLQILELQAQVEYLSMMSDINLPE